MKIACAAQITNVLEANLSGLIKYEEADVNMNVDELKYHKNKNKLANLNLDTENTKIRNIRRASINAPAS